MAERVALIDFLDGVYIVNGTNYALTDVIGDRGGQPVVVDSSGLVLMNDGHHDPIAAGPFLSAWGALYDDGFNGFTCIIQYGVSSGASNGLELVAIDATGGPGRVDLSWAVNIKIEIYMYGGSGPAPSNPTNPPGSYNNTVWQWSYMNAALSTNGSPVASSGGSTPDEPLSYDITFNNYGSLSSTDVAHIQWIGLYDGTADTLAFPSLSVVGAKPPTSIPSRVPGPFTGAQVGDIVQLGGGNGCPKFVLETIVSSTKATGSFL